MKIKIFQKGFNYSEDGPGNRLVLHLQGCNLHCPWCSNPEGMSVFGGEERDVEELLEEIERCKRLFFDGGGVTATGGECTLQRDALLALAAGCKVRNIHFTIETNATCPYEETLFENVDLIIVDCKHYDEAKLSERVGQVRGYQKNIADYLSSGKPVLVRTVLINGFNATKADAEKFAAFFAPLPTTNAQFEFLRYHEYGKAKWEKLGKAYQMQDAFVTEETVKTFEDVFHQNHLKTIRS